MIIDNPKDCPLCQELGKMCGACIKDLYFTSIDVSPNQEINCPNLSLTSRFPIKFYWARTTHQDEFIKRLELSIANAVNDGNKSTATKLASILECLPDSPVLALCLASSYKFPHEYLLTLASLFNVRNV